MSAVSRARLAGSPGVRALLIPDKKSIVQLHFHQTGRQSARMSKITNDRLTRSGTGCFIDVPIW